ncbi:MAG: hypothetical protein ACRDRT_01945, partial [Pseudonocardiaceae bacterium]
QRTLGVLLVTASLWIGACGSSADISTSASTWTVPVPPVKPKSLDELMGVVLSPPGPNAQELTILSIPAAVFDNNSGKPHTDHPDWKALVALACDSAGIVQVALKNGWDVLITGFVDSVGPFGPGTRNEELPLERANEARSALLARCQSMHASIPNDSALAKSGGLSPDNTRKVVVTVARGARGDK